MYVSRRRFADEPVLILSQSLPRVSIILSHGDVLSGPLPLRLRAGQWAQRSSGETITRNDSLRAAALCLSVCLSVCSVCPPGHGWVGHSLNHHANGSDARLITPKVAAAL